MLEINVRDIKELSFEAEIGGVTPDQLECKLRLIIDNIEYGIPAKISEGEITVEIPPLKRLVQREMREGETFAARLDVIGDSQYIKPWSGEFKVKNPVVVEAKIKEEPEIKVKLSEKKSKPTGKSKAEEKLAEMKSTYEPKKKITKKPAIDSTNFKKKLKKEHVLAWMAKKGTKNPRIQEILYEQAETEVGSTEPYKIMIALSKALSKRGNLLGSIKT